jgi:hypothetical protein
MEQQNPNTQNNQPHNQANTAHAGGQDQRNESNRAMHQQKSNQDRKPGQDNRNGGRDKNNRPNDRNRGQKDNRYPQKTRDQKTNERPKDNAPAQRAQQNANNAPSHGANHQNRPSKSAHHGESRQIKAKRVETLEDIKADIERVEKDIQLEIKQIRAIKLGL